MFYVIEVGRDSFRAEMASDVHMIGEVLFDLEQYLKIFPLPLPLEELKQAVSEGLSNAIVHGNRINPFLHAVFQLLVRGETLRMIFENGGPGFDWRQTLAECDGAPATADALPPKEGGLARLRRLSYRLEFNDPGTILAIHKNLT